MSIFILGIGYTGGVFASRMRAAGHAVGGTARDPARVAALRQDGIAALAFDVAGEIALPTSVFEDMDGLLVSIPPGREGDPLPGRLAPLIAAAARLRWIGYLSTVGVYGDHGGAWIDETTLARPLSARSRARLTAEATWLALGEWASKPVIVFRLPGIYGPQRNALVSLRQGAAHRIVKPGQVFNRVHVEDIASGLALSLAKDCTSAIYNLTDDEPSPPEDVVTYAATLLGVEPPAAIAFAAADLSPMAASFYGESKRVSNHLIRRALGFAPTYPSYREGLQALLRQGEGRA